MRQGVSTGSFIEKNQAAKFSSLQKSSDPFVHDRTRQCDHQDLADLLFQGHTAKEIIDTVGYLSIRVEINCIFFNRDIGRCYCRGWCLGRLWESGLADFKKG